MNVTTIRGNLLIVKTTMIVFMKLIPKLKTNMRMTHHFIGCDNISAQQSLEKQNMEESVDSTLSSNVNNNHQSRKTSQAYGNDCNNLYRKSQTFAQQIEPILVTRNARKFHIDLTCG